MADKKEDWEEGKWICPKQDAAKHKINADYYQQEHLRVGIANLELKNARNIELEKCSEDLLDAEKDEPGHDFNIYKEEKEKEIEELETKIQELNDILEAHITKDEAVALKVEL